MYMNVFECAFMYTGQRHRIHECGSIFIDMNVSECTFLSTTERWGAGVETQKNEQGEVGGWGRVPFNEPYAPSLSTIYDGA